MSGTYLQMPQAMGGMRFGPFPPGIIQIGSDPARCQIVLQASLGVFPIHCMLSDQGNGQYTLSPTRQGLGLFLIQAGEQKAWPIEGAVQAKPGDIIVVGSEGGPRFTIEHMSAAQQAQAIGGGPDALPPGVSNFGNRLMSEASRQAQAKLIARNPVARQAYNIWVRLKSGSLNNPYYIVSGVGAVIAALAGGAVTCSGLALAIMKQLMG